MRLASRCAALLGTALLLQGCGTLSKGMVQNVPHDYDLSTLTSRQEAIIVFSGQFRQTGCPGESKIASASMDIAGGDSIFRNIIFLKSPMLETAPEHPNLHLYVRRLRAGGYSFGDIHYTYTALGGKSSNRTARMPFSLEAGQVYYLGEVTVTAEDCWTLNVSVSNQRERDMRWLAPRLIIRPESVRDQILQIKDVL